MTFYCLTFKHTYTHTNMFLPPAPNTEVRRLRAAAFFQWLAKVDGDLLFFHRAHKHTSMSIMELALMNSMISPSVFEHAELYYMLCESIDSIDFEMPRKLWLIKHTSHAAIAHKFLTPDMSPQDGAIRTLVSALLENLENSSWHKHFLAKAAAKSEEWAEFANPTTLAHLLQNAF